MHQKRARPFIVPLDDGRVLVASGTRARGAVDEVWEPREDRWTVVEGMVRDDGALVGVKGLVWDASKHEWQSVERLPERSPRGKLILPDRTIIEACRSESEGGRTRKAQEAARARVTVKAKGEKPRAFALESPRIKPEMTALLDGRILLTGGHVMRTNFSWDTYERPVQTAELLDLGRGAVTSAGTLVTSRYNHGASLLPSGQVLVAGGYLDEEDKLDSVELGTPL
jgi:hypothetical protein